MRAERHSKIRSVVIGKISKSKVLPSMGQVRQGLAGFCCFGLASAELLTSDATEMRRRRYG